MLKHCKTCRRDLDNTHYADGYKTCSQCLEKKSIKRTNKKLTLKNCQDLASIRNGVCLSTEYINNRTKMEWKCEKGHSWCASMDGIKNKGSWCPQCMRNKLTLKECQNFAISKNGKCLSIEYKNSRTKMEWECENGHKWSARMHDIKNGGEWCPTCYGNAKLTLKDCQNLAISKNGLCLSIEYKNNNTKMEWKCSKDHIWSAAMEKIKNKGSWCPQCSGYKSEELCREIFEDNLLEKFPKKRPEWLHGLELDGYNEELNIAFEYNGIQHYEYNEHFHRGDMEFFEAQKERDRMKYRICREKKVNLVIIPYQYDYRNAEELEDYILNELIKFS